MIHFTSDIENIFFDDLNVLTKWQISKIFGIIRFFRGGCSLPGQLNADLRLKTMPLDEGALSQSGNLKMVWLAVEGEMVAGLRQDGLAGCRG